jgi:wyosine [tRNA(Phe)-imidazoG37] synthetase (radical SAM superfamily)
MEIDRAVIEINGGAIILVRCVLRQLQMVRQGARGKNWLKKMSLEAFEDAVAQCAEAGLNVVNLEGSGEPTLNNDLPSYIAIVKKYGAKAFMFSNGMKMSGGNLCKKSLMQVLTSFDLVLLAIIRSCTRNG